jgi:hypothetical protein
MSRSVLELVNACKPRSGGIFVAQCVSAGNEINMRNKASRGAATSPSSKIADPKWFVPDYSARKQGRPFSRDTLPNAVNETMPPLRGSHSFSSRSLSPSADGRVAQLVPRAYAGTFRDPCRGRLSLLIRFRWRRAKGACHRLPSGTPPACSLCERAVVDYESNQSWATRPDALGYVDAAAPRLSRSPDSLRSRFLFLRRAPRRPRLGMTGLLADLAGPRHQRRPEAVS